MSKTPIQTAIEQICLEINKSNSDIEYYKSKMMMSSVRSEHDIQTGLQRALNILTALLPTEREVIEEAWCDGENGYGAASDYFTTKFNDNENTN